jgi:hypothetical protein
MSNRWSSRIRSTTVEAAVTGLIGAGFVGAGGCCLALPGPLDHNAGIRLPSRGRA